MPSSPRSGTAGPSCRTSTSTSSAKTRSTAARESGSIRRNGQVGFPTIPDTRPNVMPSSVTTSPSRKCERASLRNAETAGTEHRPSADDRAARTKCPSATTRRFADARHPISRGAGGPQLGQAAGDHVAARIGDLRPSPRRGSRRPVCGTSPPRESRPPTVRRTARTVRSQIPNPTDGGLDGRTR